MARRGLMTALQAALAGAGGFGQGVLAQREMGRKRMLEDEERKRRQALDIADLQERGYMSPEQLAKTREQAAPATSRVAQSAILSALSPTRPAPMPSTADIGTVMETAALRQPTAGEQRLSMYGQEFVRPESPLATVQRERSMSAAQRAFESAEDRRARAGEQDAARKFQLERDKANRAFEAAQKRLDREAQQAQRTVDMGNKPPTEAQERNAVYYNLMSNSQRELEALRGNKNIRPWAITAYLNTPGAKFGRGMLTDEEQQFIRAAQDFTAGVLRKETGAAATKSEVEQTLERYIEMGGEGEGSTRAKVEARQRVTDAMRISAMPAITFAQRYQSPSQPSVTGTRPPLSQFER